jgi:hypothetical protein
MAIKIPLLLIKRIDIAAIFTDAKDQWSRPLSCERKPANAAKNEQRRRFLDYFMKKRSDWLV